LPLALTICTLFPYTTLFRSTGEDPAVEEYVFKWPVTQRFLEKLYDMLDFLIPQYTRETKSHLLIGIGCTGGRHRSVAVARKVARSEEHTSELQSRENLVCRL